MAAKETLTVLYDGECPFCKRYVHMVRLRDNFDVQLLDARNNSDLKDQATQAGYDLDIGMLVHYQGKHYFADDAVFLLTSLSTPSDFFNRLMMKLFSSEKVTAFLYPILAFFRRVTLFLLQNELIGNVPPQPKKKLCGVFVHCSIRNIITDPALVADVCIRLTAICFLTAFAYSWPLWFPDNRVFSPAPLMSFAATLPAWVTYLATWSMVFSCVVLFFRPQLRRLGLVVALLLVFLILQDELRWQPFVYMYAFILFSLSFVGKTPQPRDFTALRLMAVGIYFWAGFYKINTAFVLQVFPWFVAPLGFNESVVFVLSCLVPFIECAIGVCLFIPRLRAVGFVLATGMLVVVLACLGPLGHNWAPIVWPWNVLLHALEAVLFLYYREPLLQKDILKDRVSLAALVLFWFLPFFGLFGKWGGHPSFMLYSGFPAVADVRFAPNENISMLPDLAQAEMVDNTIPLMRIVGHEFNLGITPGLKGYSNLTEGAKGLCKHLLYPQQARLVVHKLPSIWSLDYQHTEWPLCPKEE